MELALEIIFLIVGVLLICFLAGLKDAWWEKRQRDKANKGDNEHEK